MGYHTRDSIPPSESSHTRGSQRRKTSLVVGVRRLLIIGSFQLNVLVNRSGRGCLGDFGLANLVDEDILRRPLIRTTVYQSSRTLRWQAPELIDPPSDESAKATPASDIYSFACVCYEVSGADISKIVLRKALMINSWRFIRDMFLSIRSPATARL